MSEVTRQNETEAVSAENRPNETRAEWIKFGILVVILFVTVVIVGAIQPLVTGYVIPKVMGWDKPATAVTEPITQPPPTGGEIEAEGAMGEMEEMGEVEQVGEPDTAASDPTPETETPETAAEAPPTTNSITYTVRAGDTLYDIARAHGTTIEAIVEATAELNRASDVIKPGMVLTIPVK